MAEQRRQWLIFRSLGTQDHFYMSMLVDRDLSKLGKSEWIYLCAPPVWILHQGADPDRSWSGGSEAAGLTGSFHQSNLQFLKLQLFAKEVLTLQDFLPIKIQDFKELPVCNYTLQDRLDCHFLSTLLLDTFYFMCAGLGSFPASHPPLLPSFLLAQLHTIRGKWLQYSGFVSTHN